MESHKADQQFGTVPFLFENVVDCEVKQKNKKKQKVENSKETKSKKDQRASKLDDISENSYQFLRSACEPISDFMSNVPS